EFSQMILVMTEDQVGYYAFAIHLRDAIIQSFVESNIRFLRRRPGRPLRTADRITSNVSKLLSGARIQPGLKLLGRHPRKVISCVTHPEVRLLIRNGHPVVAIGRFQKARIIGFDRRYLSLFAFKSLNIPRNSVIPHALAGGSES